MFKKVLSLIILVMYLHGMSGYSINFHKCTITGFENVYTGYGSEDPCAEAEPFSQQASACFERGNCCDLQQTLVWVDDDRDVANFNIQFSNSLITSSLFPSGFIINNFIAYNLYSPEQFIKPPELSAICTFRI
jgi:hypothetical protein